MLKILSKSSPLGQFCFFFEDEDHEFHYNEFAVRHVIKFVDWEEKEDPLFIISLSSVTDQNNPILMLWVG